jgi:hypothetical protein
MVAKVFDMGLSFRHPGTFAIIDGRPRGVTPSLLRQLITSNLFLEVADHLSDSENHASPLPRCSSL